MLLSETDVKRTAACRIKGKKARGSGKLGTFFHQGRGVFSGGNKSVRKATWRD